MPKIPPPCAVHPTGEPSAEPPLAPAGFRAIDTFDGAVHLRWDPEAAATTFGQMAYFIEFLKTSGLFEEWVADAPLTYRSPNPNLSPKIGRRAARCGINVFTTKSYDHEEQAARRDTV